MTGQATSVGPSLRHENVPFDAATQSFAFDGKTSYVQYAAQAQGYDDFSISLEFLTNLSCGWSSDWWPNGCGLVGGKLSYWNTADFGVSIGAGRVHFGVEGTTILSSLAYDDGMWHSVWATRSSETGSLLLVVDGVQVASGVSTTGTLTKAPFIYVGTIHSAAAGDAGVYLKEMHFEGSIRNARLAPLPPPPPNSPAPPGWPVMMADGTADTHMDIQFIDIGSGRLSGTGTLDAVAFQVVRANQDVRFQIYRPVGGNVYRLVSESQVVYPDSTGEHGYNLDTPLAYQDGDYIGWVHTGKGTFPFVTGQGGNVRWKAGVESVGSDIDFNGQDARIYGYRVTLSK